MLYVFYNNLINRICKDDNLPKEFPVLQFLGV